jgi:hypothetical protein
VDINPKSSDPSQHSLIVNKQHSKQESTNSENMIAYSLIQPSGWNQFMEELVKDITDQLQKIESHEFIVKSNEFFAIHLYLGTVIDFLHRNKILNTNVKRMFFEDEKVISWITNFNLFQLTCEGYISWEDYTITDVTKQWFWKLKWNFLNGIFLDDSLLIDKSFQLTFNFFSHPHSHTDLKFNGRDL